MYLYEGRPGTGKTTIALQFLLEGVRRGERVLYITLSETRRELALVAKRHGWTLRSEEHTSELQSLMRISYAVICLKKKKKHYTECSHRINTTTRHTISKVRQ